MSELEAALTWAASLLLAASLAIGLFWVAARNVARMFCRADLDSKAIEDAYHSQRAELIEAEEILRNLAYPRSTNGYLRAQESAEQWLERRKAGR